jgi:polar amino acid transport system substrate-binding protein
MNVLDPCFRGDERGKNGVIRLALVFALLLLATSTHAVDILAPTGTLRAVYLGNNPAQAVRDSVTGAVRGVSADLVRELGRRRNVMVALNAVSSPAAVIEAVAKGEADIGFVAFAPERVGTIAFSQVYMLVQQSFIVPDASPIQSVGDIDEPGMRVAGGEGDSITLYMKRNIRQAILIETGNTLADTRAKFAARAIDAFGANRQRLTTWLKDMPGYRLLPDNLFGVPQTIVVGKDKSEALDAVNAFIDDVRGSGFLQEALTRSGIVGIAVAPPGFKLEK